MDTKEKNTAPKRRRSASQTARRQTAAAKTARRPKSGSAAAAKTAQRRRAQDSRRRQRPASGSNRAAAAQNRARRTVRPPREDIPEVVYTMPQPFRRGRFLVKLISVVAVVMALMLAVSIFFKVDTITVTGAQKYTAWMVREASGIEEGDGLLTLSKARAAGKIQSALAYVDEVKISIKLPGTVNIEITELAVTYAVEAQDTTWWLITSDGRVVEQVDASTASGYTRLYGVLADAPRVGQQMTVVEDLTQTEATDATEETQPGDELVTLPTQTAVTNAQRFQAALTIFQSLEANGVIGQVASVNVESLSDIGLQYGQRFEVKLGDSENLAYKIDYMATAINQMAEYQSGILDVSFEYSEQGIFTPES